MEYENYTARSKNYDETRVAVGVQTILDSIPGPLSEATVLDAGSGTGNYTIELAKHVKGVTAMDVNEGMLDRLREKLVTAQSVAEVTVVQHSLLDLPLPFPDASFTAVTMLMVAHHLDRDPARPHLAAAIKEFRRLLKPGGVFIMSTMDNSEGCDQRSSIWEMSMVTDMLSDPSIKDLAVAYDLDGKKTGIRIVAPRLVREMCDQAGFSSTAQHINREHLTGRNFYNFMGSFDPKVRDGNSMFAIMKGELLEVFLDRIRREMDEGTFIMKRVMPAEKNRIEGAGTSTFIVANL